MDLFLGFLIALFQIISEKKDTMSLRTKVKRLQVELDSLRNYAIEDDIDIKDSNASFDVKNRRKSVSALISSFISISLLFLFFIISYYAYLKLKPSHKARLKTCTLRD